MTTPEEQHRERWERHHRRRKNSPWPWVSLLLAMLATLGFAILAAAETGCRVVDGDTLRCDRERIRVQGIDTPEKGQPGCDAAKERLRQLTEGKNLLIDRVAKDRYGRTVGRVTVDGMDVGSG